MRLKRGRGGGGEGGGQEQSCCSSDQYPIPWSTAQKLPHLLFSPLTFSISGSRR